MFQPAKQIKGEDQNTIEPIPWILIKRSNLLFVIYI